MIVPLYWSEARLHQPRTKARGQVTVRRFGWSDISQADADQRAQARAREAFEHVLAGKPLPRSEPKVAYNGAEGVPIREEVLARHGDTVITRNLYGAQCLNTPDVLFADIDFETPLSAKAVLGHAALLAAAAAAFAYHLESWGIFFGVGFLALVLGYPFAESTRRLLTRLNGGAEARGKRRITAYVQAHPDWHLRLYRTPAGFRVLALHAVFAPTAPEVSAFFDALGVDPVYARMCRNQQCFRARLTPKPWRIGLTQHLKPRPGVWPVKPEHLEGRRHWVRSYEQASATWASCRFVEALGSQTRHPRAAAVADLHDQLCHALSGRKIA